MQNAVRRLVVLGGLVAAVLIPASAMGTSSAGSQHYTVAFNSPNSLPANVDQMVKNAGGTIVERIPQIGGIGVESSNPSFASDIAKNSSVKAADVSVQAGLIDPVESDAAPATSSGSSTNNGGTYSATGPDCGAACMPDPLGSEQWDKMKMHASNDGSYAVQPGRRDVRVFVIDTGADQTHPDIAQNYDAADSISFVPTEPTPQDFNGHGTWTISAVGAPINGVGISGVAPNVTLVEGKVLNSAGSGQFLWTDQALVYAGQKHFDVVSASLGGYIPKCGNPNCDHPDYILLVRATEFARSNGVLPIAALGNDGLDLADGNFMRNLVEAPGEVPGWVGVSATGYHDDKAWYSSYGDSAADVSAPGGSTRNYLGIPGQVECGTHTVHLCRLLGAWSSTALHAPNEFSPVEACTGPANTPPCYPYGWVQGTSMATPNTAGVAALIISQYGDFSQGGNPNHAHMSPNSVESILQITANNQPCPEPNTVTQGPNQPYSPLTATCQGNTGYNNFFGKGIVDALNAVTFHG